MASTLESFVNRLRADGLEAGQRLAEQIRREAEEKAAEILREAEAKAQQILADAEAQREKILARAQTELKLAARDAIARLSEALNQAVNQILNRGATERLNDPEFLKRLIEDLVHQYVSADSEKRPFILNVSDATRHRLTHWVLNSLYSEAQEAGLSVELRGALKSAGFEYQITDGSVEITPEAVVQILSEMVTPEIQKLVLSAAQVEHAVRV